MDKSIVSITVLSLKTFGHFDSDSDSVAKTFIDKTDSNFYEYLHGIDTCRIHYKFTI